MTYIKLKTLLEFQSGDFTKKEITPSELNQINLIMSKSLGLDSVKDFSNFLNGSRKNNHSVQIFLKFVNKDLRTMSPTLSWKDIKRHIKQVTPNTWNGSDAWADMFQKGNFTYIKIVYKI